MLVGDSDINLILLIELNMKKFTHREAKILKLEKQNVIFVVVIKIKMLLSKMHEEKILRKKGRCNHRHCSFMGKSAWRDLDKDGTILKLHDMCPSSKCNCQKQVPITPKHFNLKIKDLRIL